MRSDSKPDSLWGLRALLHSCGKSRSNHATIDNSFPGSPLLLARQRRARLRASLLEIGLTCLIPIAPYSLYRAFGPLPLFRLPS
jgi:hypothetical protein